jgi:hypothetical protein
MKDFEYLIYHDRIDKALQIINKLVDIAETPEQINYLRKLAGTLGIQDGLNAKEYAEEYEHYEERKMKNFDEILREGGHRRHISQELRDKFIHNVLIIPNPEDRQSEIDSIFAEIAEKNSEVYFKNHPELKKEQDEKE